MGTAMRHAGRLLVLGLVLAVPGCVEPPVGLSPENPEFLRVVSGQAEEPVENASGHRLGYIPSPLDLSHLSSLRHLPTGRTRRFSVTYDLRDLNRLPPVRDQGNCGSCWTFATMGSMESCQLPEEELNLSENNLNNQHGFDYSPCSGGNQSMSTAYFARWGGPVYEDDDPYLDYDSPDDLQPRRHVQDVIYIGTRGGPADNDRIKEMVMTYGAVYTAIRWSDSYFSSSNDAFNCTSTGSTNHAVTIVGWDDDFSRSRFLSTPDGDGAFIIRNSWGSSWGDDGYFYASYYSKDLKYNVVFHNADSVDNFTYIHQYDPLGWSACVGQGGVEELDVGGVARVSDSETYWGANVFETTTGEFLSAVSFYTAAFNTSYRVFFYTGVDSDPLSGVLAGQTSGTIDYPGYHTVEVADQNVWLAPGSKFAVAVEFTTPGYSYPVPVEYPISRYNSDARAGSGESWVRASEQDSWIDLVSQYDDTNVCIKAFTLMDCNDQNPCTLDQIDGAQCRYTEVICDDGNECTADVCDPAVGCTGVPVSDCSLCQGSGACINGNCIAGGQNGQLACDDGNACTLDDVCQGGVCQGQSPVECLPLGPCRSAGVCEPATGLCSDPAAPDGTPCQGSDICYQTFACQQGNCVGSGPVPDGTPCDDHDLCTPGSACLAGTCQGQDPVICSPLDACHLAGVCDPATGLCSNPLASDGTVCDDQEFCTQNDVCQSGICTGTVPVPNGSPCPRGFCKDNVCQEVVIQGGCGCSGSGRSGGLGSLIVLLFVVFLTNSQKSDGPRPRD